MNSMHALDGYIEEMELKKKFDKAIKEAQETSLAWTKRLERIKNDNARR